MGVNDRLFIAVADGKLEKARELINSFGLSFSEEEGHGCHAVKNNPTAVAKLVNRGSIKMDAHEILLKQKAYVNARGRNGVSPLYAATCMGRFEMAKFFLNYGADVNASNRNGDKPLHAATYTGRFEMAKLFLNYGADVNASNRNGDKPLHAAINVGRFEMAKLFLNYGADVNARDSNGEIPLLVAIKVGRLEMIKLLFTHGANLEDSPDLLNIAVMFGREAVVEALLENGADIHARDEYGRTALYFTALSDFGDYDKYSNRVYFNIREHDDRDSNAIDNVGEPALPVTALSQLQGLLRESQGKMAELLLNKGASVDAQTSNGLTTLQAAITNGYVTVVKALLEHNANVVPGVESGNTPLHLSARIGNEEICTILLNKGANVNAKQKNGTTALHIAAQNGHEEVVKVLLESGAKVNSKMQRGCTPLHFGAKDGYCKIIEIILKFGANIDATDEYGRTPLHIAVQNGHEEVVKVLLKRCAQVNSKTQIGFTPLHFGANDGYCKIIEIILKFGANIDATEEYGRTPLHIASEKGREEVVVTLLEYGSDINITCRNGGTPLDHALAGIRWFRNETQNVNDYYFYNYGVRGIAAREATAKALLRHIVQMKTKANLSVSEENLQSMSKSGEMSGFQDECEEEISRMKNEKINNQNISFYDILAKDTSSLAKYMRNENIVQVLNSGDYKIDFPIYASMIECHFKKAMERKELLEQGIQMFHCLFNNVPKLPYDCTEPIFSYQSDEDLKNLMDACKPLSISTHNTNV